MPAIAPSLDADLHVLRTPSRDWTRWLSILFSFALIGMMLFRAERGGAAALDALVPRSPVFWIALMAYYAAGPVSEWIIFRRLWGITASGITALLRKRVSNEVLLSYSGEISFYLWARRNAKLVAAPFAAIKDVSITSALAGNVATLCMIAIAWRSFTLVHSIISHVEAGWSAAVLIVASAGVLLFRRKIFSLPVRQLRFVFGVHVARLCTTTLMSGLIWHSALPGVPLALWLLLAAVQLLVTRLPLVPNKELVFASLAVFVVGHDQEVALLITLVSGLIFLFDIAVGGALVLADLHDTAAVS